MHYKNYNLLALLLLLFFSQVNAQVSCAGGNFESSNNLGSYSFQTAIESNHNECSGTINNLNNLIFPPLTGFPSVNSNDPVTFVNNQQNDPTLASFSVNHPQINPDGGQNQGLRLGFISQTGNIVENTTVLTKSLGNITERYLNIDFSVVFHFPNDHEDRDLNFVRFSIIDLNTGLDISQISPICIKSDDSSLNTVGSGFNTWKYSDWDCISFDLNNYVGLPNNLGLKIIAADCGQSQHDTLLYLDNICIQNSDCENEDDNPSCTDGNISMNPININCPSNSFTVSGNYTLPSCAENPTNIVLNLVSSNNQTTTIAQNNFSNNSYSFTINPLTLNLDSSLQYDLVATANFSQGNPESISNPGREITFNNCQNQCDNFWVAILDEYIDGTQSGSNSVFLIANGNYPSGTTYAWTTTRQSGLIQTYPPTTNNIRQVSTSFNNRIVSASVTVSYMGCTETVNKTFTCPIPNNDANGNLFSDCGGGIGGGGIIRGFSRSNTTENTETIKIFPNPIQANQNLKINGLDIESEIEKIELIDILGNTKKVSLKLKSNTLNIGQLQSGIYFLKIHTSKGIKQKRLIVK